MIVILFKRRLSWFLALSSFFSANAQVQALFNDKVELKTMSARWELDSTSSRGTFLVTPYKPIYVLPFRWSSNPNEQPQSGNNEPEYVNTTPVDYDAIESKFQLSFKTKILQNFLWGHADLWVAYTQVSIWQIYNEDLSRPFREINYEPEVILNFPVNFNFLGFKAKMLGVGFNHESNGKSIPLSRSWNRIIFLAGFERDNWNIYIRPWIQLKDSKGDNPDISQYMGRGDLNVIYSKNKSVYSFTGSHNLNFGGALRGNATFSWSYPIKGNLKGLLQVSHGYGDTLIDYNNNQTTIGVGVSLIEWQ